MSFSQSHEFRFALEQRDEVSLVGIYLTQISSLFAAIKKFDEGNHHVNTLAELGEFLSQQQAESVDEITEKIDNLLQNLKAAHNVSNA